MADDARQKPKPETPDHLGHRKRLRDRFLQGGPGALPDYELLELILFQAQPRADTKPIAKALLKRFGSFARVISADPSELQEVRGIRDAGVAALKAVQEGALRLTRTVAMEKAVLSSWNEVIDYCRASMAYRKTEAFRLLFLDRKNRLIADEVQQTGTVDHTPVYPREVVKRALELGASAIIMVHNHPSGDPTPSRADIDMTAEVRDAGEKLGVTLHDHIIIGGAEHVSLRAMGFL